LNSFDASEPPPPPVDPFEAGLFLPDAATLLGATGGAGACAGHGALPGDFSGSMGPMGCISPEAGAVLSVLSILAADGSVLLTRSFPAAVVVDVAVSPDGSLIAVAAAGNGFVPGLATVFVFSSCGDAAGAFPVDGQPVAVAFDATGDLVVQTREPAQLVVLGGDTTTTIPLSADSRRDTGHDVFHTQAGALIACASCHPEGGDDGHVWLLDGERRRTPSLRGTIPGTAPYHWPGDMQDLQTLVNDVYTVRMSGQPLGAPMHQVLRGWIEAIPAPAAPSWVDPGAVVRGQALFERSDVGCASCHSGPHFTDNATVDVGTGGAFQVPSLIGVGWRTPLMHDGCARTLADRFDACATAQHGSTGSLSSGEVADLIAYLETL
jgi:mono/diheme cytochrome c family protein